MIYKQKFGLFDLDKKLYFYYNFYHSILKFLFIPLIILNLLNKILMTIHFLFFVIFKNVNEIKF